MHRWWYTLLPMTNTHDSKKAGNGPQNLFCFANASKRYAYSAPLRGTTVPSSAKQSAPEINFKVVNKKNIFFFNFGYLIATRNHTPSIQPSRIRHYQNIVMLLWVKRKFRNLKHAIDSVSPCRCNWIELYVSTNHNTDDNVHRCHESNISLESGSFFLDFVAMTFLSKNINQFHVVLHKWRRIWTS